MIRQGRIPAVKIGRRLRVALPDIETFEVEHRVQRQGDNAA